MNIDAHLSALEKLEVIPEKDVKAICEKVRTHSRRPKKFSWLNPISSMSERPSPSAEIRMDNSMIY